MFAVLVDFRIDPIHADAFAGRVQQQASDSLRLEQGCHVFDVCRNGRKGEQIFLYEIYEDEAAFDLHLQSDHFKAFDREVQDWILEKTVRAMRRLQDR